VNTLEPHSGIEPDLLVCTHRVSPPREGGDEWLMQFLLIAFLEGK
jgi:hypothetical protein